MSGLNSLKVDIGAGTIKNIAGEPLALGKITFRATDAKDQPIAVRYSDGTQALNEDVIRGITNGGITGADVNLPNPVSSSPANYRLRITIKDLNTQKTTVYPGVQIYDVGGEEWSMLHMDAAADSGDYPFVFGPAGRDGYSAAPLIAMLENAGDVTTTLALAGGSATTATPNTVVSAGTTVYSPTPFLASAQVYKVVLFLSGTAGQYFDLLVGTPSTPTPNVTQSHSFRITLKSDVANNAVPTTFIAGTDFPSIEIESGQLIGVKSTSGQVSIAYSNQAGPGIIFSDLGTTSFTSYSTGDICLSVMQLASVALAPALTTNPASAVAGVLESTGVATVGAGTFGGSNPSNSITVATDSSTITAWLNGAPFATSKPLYKIVIGVSSGAAGSYFDLLLGTVSGSTPSLQKRIRLYLPVAVSSFQAVTFYAGLDFFNIVPAIGQVLGYQTYTGQAQLGYASSGPGFIYANTPGSSYSSFAGDLCIAAYTLTSPLSMTFAPAAAATAGTWAGKRWVNFGDSYSAIFSNIWQNAVAGIINTPLYAQYAVAARTIVDANSGSNFIFTEFMVSGAFSPSALATALAGVDLITVALGTNDASRVSGSAYPIGTLGDAATAFTLHGGIRRALEALQTAAPLAKIVWIGPLHVERLAGQALPSGDFDNWSTDVSTDAVITALQQECASRGVPLVDVGHNAGFNKWNIANPDGSPLLLRDHLHPSDTGFTKYFAPYIGRHLQLLALS